MLELYLNFREFSLILYSLLTPFLINFALHEITIKRLFVSLETWHMRYQYIKAI